VFNIEEKIMCITADNASANDVMMTQLAEMVLYFTRQLACSQCFLHITNLVAKSLIRQFDTAVNGQETGESSREVDSITDETMIKGGGTDSAIEIDDDAIDDEESDWIDELAELDPEELAHLEQSIRPIRQMLSKVRFTCQLSDL